MVQGAEVLLPCLPIRHLYFQNKLSPLLVVAPVLEGDAVFEDIKAAMSEVAKVYPLLGSGDCLTFSATHDYSRFTEQRQREAANWLSRQVGN